MPNLSLQVSIVFSLIWRARSNTPTDIYERIPRIRSHNIVDFINIDIFEITNLFITWVAFRIFWILHYFPSRFDTTGFLLWYFGVVCFLLYFPEGILKQLRFHLPYKSKHRILTCWVWWVINKHLCTLYGAPYH